MSNHNVIPRTKVLLLAMFLVGGICFSQAPAQSSAPTTAPSAMSQASVNATKPAAAAPRYFVPSQPRRAQMYYQGVWGIDSLRVKRMESGELVRFTWRVLDPAKAQALSDKKAEPSLIDPQAGVKLVVPAMENVGILRQTNTPEAGKSYWVAFSNVGRRVKPGDRVIVVIGQFKAEGLVVE